MNFDFQKAHFDYEPYPIGLIKDFLPPDRYRALSSSYPRRDLFDFKPTLGDKYSLSELNNATNYKRFIDSSPEWRQLHEYIKGTHFIPAVLAFLSARHIDLGIPRYKVVSRKAVGRRASAISRILRYTELSARFEFSMMGANGGHILPHTDSANKLITLVISMMQPGEWDSLWGGGTDVVLPRDRSRLFNHVNHSLPLSEVEVLKTFAFEPNQCVLFIKTFNSWHSVSPMRGQGSAALRKTLTINIEAKP